MGTTTDETMKTPNAQELHQAMISFVTTTAGVAYVRSKKFGPQHFSLLSRSLSESFIENFSKKDAKNLISDFDEKSQPALTAIYEELIYVSKRYEKYGKKLNSNMYIPDQSNKYKGNDGDPFSEDAVKEIVVVKGSIDFILDKLPKWAKKILEAIMEVLKISRGAI